MTPALATRILIALSIIYGTSIAVVEMTAPSATATVAIIGALTLGVLWTLRSVFFARK